MIHVVKGRFKSKAKEIPTLMAVALSVRKVARVWGMHLGVESSILYALSMMKTYLQK
jgi:hypothetical protein